MASKSGTSVVPIAPKDTTTFYLPPMVASMVLGAIVSWQMSDNPMSGKQARKLGRIKRALSDAVEQTNQERQDVVNAYRRRYPEGHAKAGEFMPAYKYDEEGKETTEEDPTQVPLQLDRLEEFNTELGALMNAPVVVECPCLSTEEIDGIRSLPANYLDALPALEKDAPTTIHPDLTENDEEEGDEEEGDEEEGDDQPEGQVAGAIKPAAEEVVHDERAEHATAE